MREDVFERKLRPCRAIEFRGPFGERRAFETAEVGAVHEWPVHEHGKAAIGGHRQKTSLGLALGDRVVELDEIRLLALEEFLELRV